MCRRLLGVAVGEGLQADLVLEEGADRAMARLPAGRDGLGQALADPRRLDPVVLILVELLELRQRVLVGRIEPQHLLERLDGAIDEAAAPVVEAEAEQHVGVLEAAEARPLQQVLVDLHGAADLSLLAIQVAQDHVDLERVRGQRGRLAHLVDRQIELVGDQEVEALHVVRRLAVAAPVEPAAFLQLVAFPGLADGQAEQAGRPGRDEQRQQRASCPRPP